MTPKEAITVFISDDHAVVRKGLVDIFSHHGITVVGEAATLQETLDHGGDHNPQVLVLDLNMNTTSGVQTVEQVLDVHPDAHILIFSMRESLNTIRATYQLGIKGYVTKSSGPELLIDAVKKIATGRNYYMPGIAERILEYDTSADKELDPREVLSAKELAIFKLIALGKPNPAIAQELGITAKSVANRTLDIRRKLGIRLTSFEWIARKYNLLKLEL